MRWTAWSCSLATAWPRWPGTATATWSCTLASAASGRVLHTINPRLHPDQIAWIVNHAEDQVLCFDMTFLPLVQAVHAQSPSAKYVAMHCARRQAAGRGRAIPGLVSYEAWIGGQPTSYTWPEFRRKLRQQHVLHQRHHRQPQGSAVQPPLHHAARLCRRAARRDEPVGARQPSCPWCPCSTSTPGACRIRPLVGCKLVFPGRRWTASRCTS
jgi:hypothetical protein